MIPLITQHSDDIAEICRRHHVKRLEVFGSAAVGDFNPDTSDIDFLVEFDDSDEFLLFQIRRDLTQELESLFNRSVDLVSFANFENPYFRTSVESTREPIFEADSKTYIWDIQEVARPHHTPETFQNTYIDRSTPVANLLNLAPLQPGDITSCGGQYGIPTEAAIEAIHLVTKTEGIILHRQFNVRPNRRNPLGQPRPPNSHSLHPHRRHTPNLRLPKSRLVKPKRLNQFPEVGFADAIVNLQTTHQRFEFFTIKPMVE